ncbi:UU173 family protein [Mycoplasmopsis sturni]|uniref:UU173 family protein n=1 Tax=Mycoplasmopsis sturni TaxID=39047 RepID=UPI00055E03CD|nr:DUF2779 domain-containing protein [Mycoplasmopsis sturni]
MKDTVVVSWPRFKRVFWNNPALIWAGNSDQELINNIVGDQYKLKWNTESDFNKIRALLEDENELDEDEVEHDFGSFLIANNNLQGVESINSVNDVKRKTYKKMEEESWKFYAQKYKIESEEILVILLSKTELAVQKTLDALNNPKIRLIVNPVFQYIRENQQNKFQYVARALLFDKELKKISLQGFTKNSTKKEFYRFIYHYDVISKITKIQSLSLIILDPVSLILKNTKAGAMQYFESFSAIPAKKASITKNNKLSEHELIARSIIKASGDFLLYDPTGKFDPNGQYSFYNVARMRNLDVRTRLFDENNSLYPKNLDQYETLRNNGDLRMLIKNPHNTKTKDQIFENSQFYFELIEKSYFTFGSKYIWNDIGYFFEKDDTFDINQKIHNFLSSGFIGQFNSDNVTIDSIFIDSKELELAIYKYLMGDLFLEYSSRVFMPFHFKKTKIEHHLQTKENYNLTPNFFQFNTINTIAQLHYKNARIIWYDYEGFSDVFPILDYTGTSQQVVSQVSVIETINGKVVNSEDIVIDTIDISYQKLVELILSIYSNKADYYVVYNKSYENTRNKEILEIIKNVIKDTENSSVSEFAHWFKQNVGTIDDFTRIIMHINNNTIDLYDCFSYRNIAIPKDIFAFDITPNGIHPLNIDQNLEKHPFAGKLSIFLKDLKFYGSIKKVEKLITSNKLELKTMITPYSDLIIQKGTMAMDEAILRYHKITGDAQWNKIKNELAKYCHNDVKAMIMVYEFIMEIIRAKFPEINDFEYQIDKTKYPQFQYTLKEGKIELQRIGE